VKNAGAAAVCGRWSRRFLALALVLLALGFATMSMFAWSLGIAAVGAFGGALWLATRFEP
jgi:signal transduction protein with GAF and PtsI domain